MKSVCTCTGIIDLTCPERKDEEAFSLMHFQFHITENEDSEYQFHHQSDVPVVLFFCQTIAGGTKVNALGI